MQCNVWWESDSTPVFQSSFMPLGDLLCVFFLASLVLSCSQLVCRAVGRSKDPEGQKLLKGLLLLHWCILAKIWGRKGGRGGCPSCTPISDGPGVELVLSLSLWINTNTNEVVITSRHKKLPWALIVLGWSEKERVLKKNYLFSKRRRVTFKVFTLH